jgi:hypothetical protein
MLQQLLSLNESLAELLRDGKKVTGPGIPPLYTVPARLISADCLK